MNRRITLEQLAGMAISLTLEVIKSWKFLWDQNTKYFSYFGYLY